MKVAIPHLNCISEPSPGRLNEDACLVHSTPDYALLAVIDGAAQRLPSRALQALYDPAGTAARFAAQLTRDVFAQAHALSPRALLLRANALLREKLETIYFPLTAETLLRHEPDLAPLREDPRLLRLLLPVAVVTAAKVIFATQTVEVAHAGDTAMFAFCDDGSTQELTDDQMGRYDDTAVELAKSIQREQGAAHLSDVVQDERMRRVNQHNGIYHNFVDEAGTPDPARGVGVINGLPELASYIQDIRFSLDRVTGLLLCSDGFLWHDLPTRQQTMREQIQRVGLSGYVQALRDLERADAGLDRYPRLKLHDDATAVYMELSPS